MNWFKADTFIDLIRHLFTMGVVIAILVLSLFFIYLPTKTNHGESITVPDLVGLSVSDLDEFLLERNLRYEISDSSYDIEANPMTVLQQFPKAGALVKENRKIYLTINRSTAPEVRLPNTILDFSLKNAQAVLASYELLRGKITYIPSPYSNLVLEMHYNGRNLVAGDYVPKGSAIDLVVGNGFGKRNHSMDNLLGMSLDDAKTLLNGTGFKIGLITGQTDSIDMNWKISKQIPAPEDMVSIGQFVDLWVVPLDSALNEQPEELLDNQNEDN